MNPIFGELDSRLSVVKRWNLLHTIQHQTVAEHAFNVARIAERIAERWFGVEPNSTAMTNILRYAIHHDDFEALSLDIPTMVKPYFDGAAFEREHADLMRVPDAPSMEKRIVKLADMLEGFHFLCVEMVMGNCYCQDHFNTEPDRIFKWFKANWGTLMPSDFNRVYIELERSLEQMKWEKSSRFSRRGA